MRHPRRTRHVAVALSSRALEGLRLTAGKRGMTVSSLVRLALASAPADRRPLATGSERILVRLTEEEAARLQAAAAAREESVSLFTRAQLAALVANRRGGGAAKRRHVQRPDAHLGEAAIPPHHGRRRRDRIALQMCGHTVPASEVEATAGGLVWCAKCSTSRYPERS
jgi:hypothetical protein